MHELIMRNNVAEMIYINIPQTFIESYLVPVPGDSRMNKAESLHPGSSEPDRKDRSVNLNTLIRNS